MPNSNVVIAKATPFLNNVVAHRTGSNTVEVRRCGFVTLTCGFVTLKVLAGVFQLFRIGLKRIDIRHHSRSKDELEEGRLLVMGLLRLT